MAGLFDTIKQNLNNPAGAAPAGGGGEETGRVRQLLRAKSGKQVSDSGPRQSALQEKVAGQQTRAQLGQLRQQGQLAGAELGEKEAQLEQKKQQQDIAVEEQRKDMLAQESRNTDQILSQFERGQMNLANSRDVAQLERAGFTMRLENKQYVDNLQREGKRRRLDDDVEFRKAFAKESLGQAMDIFKDEQMFDAAMRADDREFKRQIAAIDINAAVDIANSQMKAESAQMAGEGVGKLGTGVAEVGAQEGWFKSQPSKEPRIREGKGWHAYQPDSKPS